MSASPLRKTRNRPEDPLRDWEEASRDTSPTKRHRFDERACIPLGIRNTLPKWLTQESEAKRSERYQARIVRDRECSLQIQGNEKHPRGSGRVDLLSRVYVGNLPKLRRLEPTVYTELFAALYVTAFGKLKPGEASPVQSFWLHSCRRYGFMQMRGTKEAVNVLLFNGLLLHGRNIRLSRPTGYRPEVRNLSAEEFVPDEIDGERLEIFFNALSGIAASPTGKAYLAALKSSKPIVEEGPGYINVEGDVEVQSSDENVGVTDSARLSDVEGVVVALVDLVDPVSLKDKKAHRDTLLDVREECSKFGNIEDAIIPNEGAWAGTAFVQFIKGNQAKRAAESLNNRSYEYKKIQVHVLNDCELAAEACKLARRR